MQDVALIFTTIGRPHVAQRLVRSAREHFPEMPIYVADQSRDMAEMEPFYRALNVRCIPMAYDAGVCASRNRLVATCAEPYVLLCDDDFVLTNETDLSGAIEVLEHCPDIGIVGGRLFDYFDRFGESVRNWELYLHLDRANRILTSTPISYFAPQLRNIRRRTVYLCDAVMNFALMRREIFRDPLVRWDPRFKSNGEHEDFFLNLKHNSGIKVAYLPTLTAGHHHPEDMINYRARLRDRNEGWILFFDKWGIDQYLEADRGVRTRQNIAEVYRAEEAQRRFLLNGSLSLDRAREDALLVVSGAHDLFPNQSVRPRAGRERSESKPSRMVVAGGRVLQIKRPEPENSGVEGTEDVTQFHTMARYELFPSAQMERWPVNSIRVSFKYLPELRADSDFTLWYRLSRSDTQTVRPDQRSGFLPIGVRWYDSNDNLLVWIDDGRYLFSNPESYWRPLVISVPVAPKGSRYLRFEVIASLESATSLMAVGFVHTRPNNRHAHATPEHVTAESQSPVSALTAYIKGLPALRVKQLLEAQAVQDIGRDPARTTSDPIAIVDLSSCRDSRRIGVLMRSRSGCASLGIIADHEALPERNSDAPNQVAVPLEAGQEAVPVVLGPGCLQ